ncbi:flavodoxin reductase-like protein [Alcanivorax hongdengensis A-11-3]|uniref:Flavodoxin reductase-like protein n=1 Tax=Alcanivorax hongdengensis A-11-3 TaxID=1177179 RepID=L0WHF9_9GAMM|nr:ferredoxin reductase [Alcanivorax hongdengensis]EKF75577.1 flavodoxin reductase-like protein [Alcanivorax hongdengensis A-11-3]
MQQTQTQASRFHSGVQRVLRSRVAQVLSYPHGVDRYLEVMNPMWSTGEVRARVEQVQHLTADSVTLTLRPNQHWQGFIPGQFVQLTVEIDGVRHTRCYSPANSVHNGDGTIELTAKAHANGFVSRYLREQMQAGQVVSLSQSGGEFALPANRPERVLLISGGSGITPVMAMLRTLCDEGHSGKITFLHYANRAEDMIYADELAEIAARHDNVELVRCFNGGDTAGELSGLFCREHLLEAVPDYADADTFLCGPPPMMAAVEALWDEEGLDHRLNKEHFTLAAPQVDSDSAEGEVRFARSETLVTNNGANLLEQAEAAGLKPESGCRMGICYSCTCRKTSGQVRDLRTGKVSSGDEQDIQLCVSVPVGTVTLDI